MDIEFSLNTALIALLIMVVLIVVLRLTNRLVRLERELDRTRTDMLAMNGAISALCEGGIDENRRREEIEHRLKSIRNRQDELELREQGGRSYSQAIKLIRRGATVDDLMAACGLNRGEAELIVNIHGSQ